MALAACAGVTACGASHASTSTRTAAAGSTSATSTATTSRAAPAVHLGAAAAPAAAMFPSARGRTLAQLADLSGTGPSLGPATGTLTPGTQRYAFALPRNSGGYLYAPTAVYIAPSPGDPAQGPYLAPADPLTVAPRYRSNENDGPDGLAAMYEAQLRLPRAGRYAVLTISRSGHRLVGATGELTVTAHSPIPDVGERPPAIMTLTSGPIALLTTRVPPESMHSVSFDRALSHRPIALLFSTPALCTSRVCGPVTDIMVSLQHEYPQITFIHQEIYVDNMPAKGMRPQLKAFHLRTEPWLFTIDSRGIIRARLEGAFGVHAARQALQAALH